MEDGNWTSGSGRTQTIEIILSETAFSFSPNEYISFHDKAEVLEEIATAVDGSMKIFVDGGIRSGTDVFKALALGADAVIIARPFVTAVYGGGREGVEAYIQKIGSELADTMAMCGVSSLAEITRDCVRV